MPSVLLYVLENTNNLLTVTAEVISISRKNKSRITAGALHFCDCGLLADK